jgi:hypothetical protein
MQACASSPPQTPTSRPQDGPLLQDDDDDDDQGRRRKRRRRCSGTQVASPTVMPHNKRAVALPTTNDRRGTHSSPAHEDVNMEGEDIEGGGGGGGGTTSKRKNTKEAEAEDDVVSDDPCEDPCRRKTTCFRRNEDHVVSKKAPATAMMTAVGLVQESLQGCVPHQLEMTVPDQLRALFTRNTSLLMEVRKGKELELQQAREHGQAVTERLQDVEAELMQWRSGKRRFVPGVIDIEADAVTSIEVFVPGVFTPGSKRPLDSGGGSLATLVKIKKEKLMVEKEKVQAEDDREDFEERLSIQALFTDFLQGKLDELKNIALVAGADRAKVGSVIQRSYARQGR